MKTSMPCQFLAAWMSVVCYLPPIYLFTDAHLLRCTPAAQMVPVPAGTGGDRDACRCGFVAWQAKLVGRRDTFLCLQGLHADHSP